MPRRWTCLWTLLCVALLSHAVQAENWSLWRGPRGDGTSLEKNIPVRWSGAENVAWKVEVPGYGHSSPVVWEDRLFLMSCVDETQQRVLLSLDRKTGKSLWRQTVVRSPLERKHRLNSRASGTPATDGKLVYVSFLDEKDMVVAAYDFEGNQAWSVRPGEFSSRHGFCSSPVLHKDLVIVNGDHDGDSYIVALKRATGETVWKVAREHKTRSYVTPIIREIDGRTQMILSGSKCVTSYDPSNGKVHWTIDGPTEQFVASMVYNGDLLFLTAGFPEHHILAIRPNGHGNVTDSHIAWRTKEGASYVPSPISAGDYFLVVSDRGIASCFVAKTGERVWKERMGPHYSASLVTAGGLVYFLSDKGVMTVVKPGREYEVVAENDLGEYCFASPAISNGQIFLRSEKHLFCIGKR